MQMRSRIEHDLPAVWIDDASLLGSHRPYGTPWLG
jgi:hypothetical protein